MAAQLYSMWPCTQKNQEFIYMYVAGCRVGMGHFDHFSPYLEGELFCTLDEKKLVPIL
jgi:hypothetical protein